MAECTNKEVATASNKEEEASDKYEDAYKRHRPIAEKAKKEYLDAYAHLADDLSIDTMKPLADALIENGYGQLEGQENFIEELRKVLPRTMIKLMEQFWESNNVDNSLISLEMLKEKFQNSEKIKSEIVETTPEERIKPMILHCKELQTSKLEKLLEASDAKIAHLKGILKVKRLRMQKISESRILLMKAMQREMMEHQNNKSDIIQNQLKMIRELLVGGDVVNKNEIEDDGVAAADGNMEVENVD